MTPERWEQIARLYHAALERDADQRASFLTNMTDGDEGLRREVTSLLEQEHSVGPLDVPMLSSAAEVIDVAAPLESGTHLGPYEIDQPLGVGGMGEVYRAHDTKLRRHVALKVLPQDLEQDAERRVRFQKEAQVLASLNHPGIGAIYGVEEGELVRAADDTPSPRRVRALVLELVEGSTLAERIARGAIPVDDSIAIATQIAVALQFAHERGVVHRDLKPANIKLRPDGTVKVLDFGLAKLAQSAAEPRPETSRESSATSVLMTQADAVLGTAAYMSPEQAKREEADRRSDVWSFACVLYEMLTGKRAFAADSTAMTLRFVLTSKPDWHALPPETPDALRALLERCLVKDRRRRISDMSVVLYLLSEAENAASTPDASRAGRVGRQRGIIAAGIVVAGISGAAFMWLRAERSTTGFPATVQFEVVTSPPNALALANLRSVSVSPDGRRVVYRAGPSWHLAIRNLDDLRVQPLPHTTGASTPFFSADGNAVAFIASGRLRRISVEGGTAVDLCPIEAPQRGGTWGGKNTIVFATSDRATGLLSVGSAGGTPQTLTTPDGTRGEFDHWYPSFLPDERGVLFTIVRSGSNESDIAVLDLATGRYEVLLSGGAQAEYVGSGYLVYAAGGGIRAVRFDLDTLQIRSDPVPVIERVMMTSLGMAEFATSTTGTLVYVPDDPQARAEAQRSLVWVDRHGREQPVGAPGRGFTTARLSPDGTRAAVGIERPEAAIWLWDLRRATLTPLNSEPGPESEPVWTPDGGYIIFTSSRDGSPNLYSQAADGSRKPEVLFATARPQYASSVSREGSQVFVTQLSGPTNRADIGALSLGGTRRFEALLNGSADEFSAEASPDGQWLAYQSNESGRYEVYARPLPDVRTGRVQISRDGGMRPAWARNSKELYYLDGNERLMAVPIRIERGRLTAGDADVLFDVKGVVHAPNVATSGRAYDVAPDGRFLMIKDDATARGQRTATFVVVHNWADELRSRMPSR